MNVRVAVVQATPVVLDGPASVGKACALIAEAAAGGAKLIALPEGFVPIMPRSCWGHHYGLIVSPRAVELHRRLWDNAVDVDGPLAATLGDAATCPEGKLPVAGVLSRRSTAGRARSTSRFTVRNTVTSIVRAARKPRIARAMRRRLMVGWSRKMRPRDAVA